MLKKEQQKEEQDISVDTPKCFMLKIKTIEGKDYRVWRDLAVELELELIKQLKIVRSQNQLIKALWNVVDEHFL